MTAIREDGLEHFLKRQISTMNGLLVHGNDESGLASIGRKLILALSGGNGVAPDIQRFDTSSFKGGGGSVVDAFAALSLLGDRTLIWIDSVGDAHLPALLPIFSAPKPANFVFMTSDALSKNSKLRLAVESSVRIAALALFEETNEALRQRLRKLLSDSNLRWDSDAEEIFLTLVGSDRSIVTQECEKLILYCFGQSIISTNDVVEICGDTASFGSDQLIDHMLAGDMNAVDRMLSSLDSESGGMRAILPMILLHLSRLIEIFEAIARGLSVELAVKA